MSNNLVEFAQEVRQETKKVTWPTRKEVVTTTIVVFIVVFIMAIILLIADFFISHGVEAILSIGATATQK
ncbi:MAG: preprotein translocase subunit SecE [Micavibrio sp.]|nr:preprotein translocase subunit SecE [Micavibrio sp.]